MNTQDLKILATDFMSHPLSRGISDCEKIGEALFDAATEIEQLRLAEDGAKEAFGHVVQDKRDLEAECKRLRELLDEAVSDIMDWGCYASAHFQQKHDLVGCVRKYREAIEPTFAESLRLICGGHDKPTGAGNG